MIMPSLIHVLISVSKIGSLGLLTKVYDVTIQRYRNSHAKIQDSKMHILQFQRCPLKFHTNFWTHKP